MFAMKALEKRDQQFLLFFLGGDVCVCVSLKRVQGWSILGNTHASGDSLVISPPPRAELLLCCGTRGRRLFFGETNRKATICLVF